MLVQREFPKTAWFDIFVVGVGVIKKADVARCGIVLIRDIQERRGDGIGDDSFVHFV